jgi:hypothetical protein
MRLIVLLFLLAAGYSKCAAQLDSAKLTKSRWLLAKLKAPEELMSDTVILFNQAYIATNDSTLVLPSLSFNKKGTMNGAFDISISDYVDGRMLVSKTAISGIWKWDSKASTLTIDYQYEFSKDDNKKGAAISYTLVLLSDKKMILKRAY